MLLPSLSSLNNTFFPADYFSARQQFLAQKSRLTTALFHPVTHRSYNHNVDSLNDDHTDYVTDAVYLGSPTAQHCVVIISGTHGVEGFIGSAVQQRLLSELITHHLALPNEVALLCIHALNPWGMHLARRCDNAGIDLNRNFIDFSTALPCNPDFDTVKAVLIQTDPLERQRLTQALIEQLGEKRFQQVLSGGQYTDPALPFFGGSAPSQSQKIIQKIMTDFDLAQRNLMVLDIHSGLGPWAYGELICDHPIDSPQETFAKHTFGYAVAVPERGTSFSVPKQGLLDYAWHAIMNDKSCFLTLEFGSHHSDALFNVIIEDHLVWAKNHDSADWQQQRQQSEYNMRQHFYPSDPYWRISALFQSLQTINRSLNAWSSYG